MAIMSNKKLSALNAGTVKVGNFIVNRLGFDARDLTGRHDWGPPRDIVATKRLLRRAIQLDVNFIDTADVYGPGVSEQLIHDVLSPYEGIIVATKGGMHPVTHTAWQPDGSPEAL